MPGDDEFKAIVYETDGVFMALCNDFPGVTGEGCSREECIADLTARIHRYLEHRKEEEARAARDEILKKIGPMRRRDTPGDPP